MSLLSTFGILFETDAKEAAKDVEGLSDELDNTTKSAKDTTNEMSALDQVGAKVSGTFSGLIGDAAKLAAGYFALNAVIGGFVGARLGVDEVGKFSQTIGENIVEVEAWGEAVARNGGTAQGFRSSLESLNTSMADIKLGGGGAVIETLSMMGIAATGAGGQIKSAFDVLPELADAFQGVSTSESFAFGKKLGLDQGTILTLQQGRQAVDELVERQKLLGGVTEEGYEAAAKFNDQWYDTKRVFNGVFMSANTLLLPALTKVLEMLENGVMWVRENQDLVEGFFIGVAAVVTAIYLPAITSAAAATIAAAAPFVAIGAAIAAVGAAFALLWEDGKAWINGADSLMGDLLGPFEDFKKGVLEVFDAIAEKWDWLVGKFEQAKGFIFGTEEEIQANVNERIQSNTVIAMQTSGVYGNNPLNSGGYSYTTNRPQTVNVEVGGATINAQGMTPQQAQQAFGDSLGGQIEGALGQLDDGVDR